MGSGRELGDRIRAARQQAHYSQRELAELIGVTEQTQRRYELGKVIPPYRRLRQYEAILGRPLDWFLGHDGQAESEAPILERLDRLEATLIELVQELRRRDAPDR